MPNTTACPNVILYQRLASGQSAEHEKEALLVHLEGCEACARRLAALPEPDTLASLLRRAETLVEGDSRETIARLVWRLSKLRPDDAPLAAIRAAARLENTVDAQPPSDADKKLCHFLAPSEVPDELGRLGPYRVLQVLGSGGMGVVFRAEDPQLMRLVALKAMLPVLAASEDARQRFLREARAAAAIKHDHIVTIYQVGEDRGVPFLAMELLEGEPLDARLQREGKLPVAEILRLGREMAEGLAAAHERNLIHRDIKPGNIWLEGKRGRVKILDFGLARSVGAETEVTRLGAIVGTPAFMAPEQAQGKIVDHRCDLFSLGCVLYRMATGTAAFRGTDLISTIMAVNTHHPAPPHEREAALPPALSELIMGLLAKEASDRPASAQAVVAALERIAAVGAASRAAPAVRLGSPDLPTTPRFRKKGPIIVGMAACLLLGLLGLWAAGVFKLKTKYGTIVLEDLPADAQVLVDGDKVQIERPGEGKPVTIRVAPGERKLEIRAGGFKVETQDVTLTAGESTPIHIHLEPLAASEKPIPPPLPRTEDKGFVPLFNGKDLKGWFVERDDPKSWVVEQGVLVARGSTFDRLNYLQTHRDYGNFILRLEFNLADQAISGVVLRAVPGELLPHPFGQRLREHPVLLLVDQPTRSDVTGMLHWVMDSTHVQPKRPAELSRPESWNQIEIVMKGRSLRAWVNGKSIIDTTLAADARFADGTVPALNRPKGRIGLLKFAGTARFRNITIKELTTEPAPIRPVPPPPPSKELEALRRDQLAPESLKMAGDGDPQRAPASLVGVLGEAQPIHTDVVRSVVFSPDGRWLASGSYDKTILLRETATGRVQRVLRGHTSWVMAVAFSKDSRTLVSASHDGTLKLWPMDKEAEPRTLQPKLGEIWGMAVSADGRFLAAGGTNGGIKLWKWAQWDTPRDISPAGAKDWIHFNGNRSASLAFSPDGEWLAVGRLEEKPASPIRLYKTADGKVTKTLPGPEGKGRYPLDMTFSRDGKYLAGFIGGYKAIVWDVASAKTVAEFPAAQFGSVGFSPDGTTLAVVGDWGPELYNLATRTKERSFPTSNSSGETVTFRPDGKMLAAGFADGTVRMWDMTNGEEKHLQGGHLHYIRSLALGIDGRTLLSAGDDDTLRRWDLGRPGENKILRRFDRRLNYVTGSPDGKKYATSACSLWFDWSQTAVVWNAATGKQLCVVDPPVGLASFVFSPDSKTLAGCSWPPPGGRPHVHLWDAATGREVHRSAELGDAQRCTPAFSSDGKLLAAASWDTKFVKVWDVASGAEVHSWQDNSMCAVAFRPDGKVLAAGHGDGTISLWDLVEGKKQRTLRGHSALVECLKFTPDGQTLVSSAHDGTLRVWNPAWQRAKEVIPLGPANRRLVMDLDPSGKYVLAAGNSPVIYVLRLP